LRVVLSFSSSHILPLLVIPGCLILSLSRPVLSLVVPHVSHVHHSHPAVIVTVVLISSKDLLSGLLDLADGELGALEVAADFGVAVVRVVMVKDLVVGVHAVLVHLLLLFVERVSVHTSLVLFLLAVADVAHGFGAAEVFVAVFFGLETFGIVFKGLGKAFSHLFVNLVTHVVQSAVHVHVLIVIFLGLTKFNHVHH